VSISQQNKHDLRHICEEISPLVDGIWFNFIYPYPEIRDSALTLLERKKAAREMLQLRRSPEYRIINSVSYIESVGKKDNKCYPFLTVNVSSTGSIHHGCTVEQLTKCSCDECDMSCYGELSGGFRWKLDAWHFLKQSLGLRSAGPFLKKIKPDK